MDTDKLQKVLLQVYGADIDPKLQIEGEEIVLEVAPEKIPFIIGRQGRNIKAIRELLFVYNKSHGTNFRLRLSEPEIAL